MLGWKYALNPECYLWSQDNLIILYNLISQVYYIIINYLMFTYFNWPLNRSHFYFTCIIIIDWYHYCESLILFELFFWLVHLWIIIELLFYWLMLFVCTNFFLTWSHLSLSCKLLCIIIIIIYLTYRFFDICIKNAVNDYLNYYTIQSIELISVLSLIHLYLIIFSITTINYCLQLAVAKRRTSSIVYL